MSQFKEQKQGNNTLVDAMRKAEEQLQSHCNMWQEEKPSLLQATERLKETLQEKRQAESTMRSRVYDLESQISTKKKKKKKRGRSGPTSSDALVQNSTN